MHEDALVGLGARAAHLFGSFDSVGHYGTPPAGSTEEELQQDLLGAVRLPPASRAQVALLVPLVETRRTARNVAEVGGGLGDVNLSARYDFLYAGQMRYVPGIAARIEELLRVYGPRGVRVLIVDSEVSATRERDARAASERGLPAIAIDAGARLADALGAEYATFAVVFDAQGRARYRGGIDSDKNVLRGAVSS